MAPEAPARKKAKNQNRRDHLAKMHAIRIR